MAWNDPGGSSDKDPWGNRNKDQGPPDLDEVVRKMQQKIGGLFGKRGGGGSGGSGTGGFSGSLIFVIVGVILVLWLVSGTYIVDAAERGIVLRFGKYYETYEPGLHWRIPYPIDDVRIVNVEEIRNVLIGITDQSRIAKKEESLMLTKDENIVNIQLTVQYRVSSAREYSFNVKDPDSTLKQVIESALREVVGKSKMDFVLTEGRVDIQKNVQTLSQAILDRYHSGLEITSINIQNAQAPDEVQDAFADVVKAREDKQRLINESQTYKNKVLPDARGNAARQSEEAEGYRQRVIARAEGEAKRFLAVSKEYEKAPRVTRERLYIETIEQVLKNTNKVLVDVKGSNNMMFLPLDRILAESRIDLSGDDVLSIPKVRSREESQSSSSSSRSFSRDIRRRRERQ